MAACVSPSWCLGARSHQPNRTCSLRLSGNYEESMKIRGLIVDDEPLARERLASLLAPEKDIEVIGQCANGIEALAAIQEKTPDLVFLDVQMPELDGFGVLSALEGEHKPAVIFVTAHDRFALKAFELHAIDYLLKPFDRER